MCSTSCATDSAPRQCRSSWCRVEKHLLEGGGPRLGGGAVQGAVRNDRGCAGRNRKSVQLPGRGQSRPCWSLRVCFATPRERRSPQGRSSRWRPSQRQPGRLAMPSCRLQASAAQVWRVRGSAHRVRSTHCRGWEAARVEGCGCPHVSVMSGAPPIGGGGGRLRHRRWSNPERGAGQHVAGRQKAARRFMGSGTRRLASATSARSALSMILPSRVERSPAWRRGSSWAVGDHDPSARLR